MTYLRKIYTNIAPTGNNISFIERHNFPYGIILGFTPPWKFFINTKCSGWSSSSILIKNQKSDNSHQNNDSPQSITHLVIINYTLSRKPSSE